MIFCCAQMAEARGVPRGNYDGPVHDVISMTKSVPPTPTTRGPPCPKAQTGPRNLHQSGFTLAGSHQTGEAVGGGERCHLQVIGR